MKLRLASIASVAVLLSGVMFSVASAESVDVKTNVNADITVHGNATSTADRAEVRGNATSTAARDNNEHASTTQETSTSTHGNLTAESHMSEVASFVQSLLGVANREGGIGAQVRVVAQSQHDSASTSAAAIAKVEARGTFRTLLLGSDYHSLGQLRSEMATTSANIAKLKGLLSNATTDSNKAELSAQIQVLENSQAQIAAFVQAHESSFSFFGWLAKLFAK